MSNINKLLLPTLILITVYRLVPMRVDMYCRNLFHGILYLIIINNYYALTQSEVLKLNKVQIVSDKLNLIACHKIRIIF